MQYQTAPKREHYYLVFKDEFLQKNGTIVHRFYEEWTNREMLLVHWGT